MASKFVKKCQNCGAEMNGYSMKCTKCGTEVQLKRNWFISFWLWLMTIGNILCLILSIVSLFNDRNTPILVQLTSVLSLFACLVGSVMLLQWKRTGFYTIVSANLVSMFIVMSAVSTTIPSIQIGEAAVLTLGGIFGVMIGAFALFGILNIRRNGISYWDAMELRRK